MGETQKKVVCATRSDVAKLAGVSETIVSYVVNDNRYVDKHKRERVLEAIKELNYQPNSIARAMKGKNSNQIVFIADGFQNGTFGEMLRHLDAYAYEKNYLLSLCANRNEDDFIRQLISRRLDGIIISSIAFSENYIQQLIDAGIPVVLLQNRDYKEVKGAGRILTGLYHGARDSVSYLYGKGRRNILYIDRVSEHNQFSTLEDYRLRGFADQMEAFDLPWKDRIITGCASFDEVYAKIKNYMKENPIDAIFARNDNMACLGLQAVLREGKRVPEDISVMGFDSSDVSRYITPALTTMEVEKKEVAKTALEMIAKMKETKQRNLEEVQFTTKLIEREST
ncbi:MAG: LacI family DNA-binding transcriptional regulator [Bacillota bacterium]